MFENTTPFDSGYESLPRPASHAGNMDDQMPILVSQYSLGADCSDHSLDLAFHCLDARNNPSMQRFLHIDHQPSFYANPQSWSPATDPRWSKSVVEQGYQRPHLENPWQRPAEYPSPPWNSARHEEMAMDGESISSGSVWSPCTNETYPEHEVTAHRPSLTPDLSSHSPSQNVEASSSFCADLSYEGSTSFAYVAPSAIYQPPEAEVNVMNDGDDDAEGESEDFSADQAFQEAGKAPYYGAQTSYAVSKSGPILPAPEEERNRLAGNGVSVYSANVEDEEIELDLKDDEGSDYKPSKRIKASHARRSSRPSKPTEALASPHSTRRASNPLSKPAKIAKQPSNKNRTIQPNAFSPTLLAHQKPCTFCPHTCPSTSSLNKHILTAHTRPFTCAFARYGCPATFGSKNEYKRHVSSQHLRPGVYRCDIGGCIPQPRTQRRKSSSVSSLSSEGAAHGYNEFNRKDLFTQHVRRMHGPSNSAPKPDKEAFEFRLEQIRLRCWIELHDPPPRTVCGFCRRTPLAQGGGEGKEVVFEGNRGWEDRMEHVARHLERGQLAEEEEEDEGLKEWMVKEGLMQWSAKEGRWRVVGIARKKGDENQDAEGDVD